MKKSLANSSSAGGCPPRTRVLHNVQSTDQRAFKEPEVGLRHLLGVHQRIVVALLPVVLIPHNPVSLAPKKGEGQLAGPLHRFIRTGQATILESSARHASTPAYESRHSQNSAPTAGYGLILFPSASSIQLAA